MATNHRVLHFLSGNRFGGVETVALTLQRLRDLTPDIEPFFLLCFEGELAEKLRGAGAELAITAPIRFSRPWTVWRARATLARLVRERNIDIVVSHEFWNYAIAAPALRKVGTPSVIWHHSAPPHGFRLANTVKKIVPDLSLACSQFVARGLQPLYGENSRGIRVVYSPVIPSSPASDRAALRQQQRRALGIADHETVILQLGRLSRYKGFHLTLSAAAGLKDLPLRVLIAAGAQAPEEHAYLAELKEQCRRGGIEPVSHFLGHVDHDEVDKVYAAADIFCQPNVTPEWYGLTFIEALQTGLPVVSTDQGGAAEILRDEQGRDYGVLVPPGDIGALAAALRRLAQNPAERQALAQAAPGRAAFMGDPVVRSAQLRACWLETAASAGRTVRQ